MRAQDSFALLFVAAVGALVALYCLCLVIPYTKDEPLSHNARRSVAIGAVDTAVGMHSRHAGAGGGRAAGGGKRRTQRKALGYRCESMLTVLLLLGSLSLMVLVGVAHTVANRSASLPAEMAAISGSNSSSTNETVVG